MEIKAELNKPYTDKQRADFIVENNHNLGYEIQETEDALLAVYNEPTIEEQNEAIRATREQLFSSSPCADYKYDYEEDVARYGQDSEQAKASADIWLAEKDKIRTENPYIEEDNSDSVLSGEPEKMAQ